MKELLLERITTDPAICFGKPCIRGTRIWVSLILELLATGMVHREIIAEYPQLTEEDIRAALVYAAVMTREHYVDIEHEIQN
ncbi:MAG TPA: DUF433 domain-containing protein [bacterium]|nr:DUF433 domain-containing protein [bacterium]HPM59273.1 DUF433 domain-containing protein [bacterium]